MKIKSFSSLETAAPSFVAAASAQSFIRRRQHVRAPGVEMLSCRVAGTCADYTAALIWRPEVGAAEVTCGFAVAPPENRADEVRRLRNLVEASMTFGAISLRLDRGRALFTAKAEDVAPEAAVRRMGRLLRGAVASCDALYPAFMLVCWSDAPAEHAFGAALYDCIGTA